MNSIITETQLVYEIASQQPDKPRLRLKTEHGWQTITWRMILDCVTQISLYFSEIGVGLNTKVAMLAKNQAEWAYFDLAIHTVRSILVPIYTSNTPLQVKYIINHADTEILVTELEQLPLLFQIWKELHGLKHVILIDLQNRQQLLEALDQFNQKTGINLKFVDIHTKIISLAEIYQIGKELQEKHSECLQAYAAEIQAEDVSVILYTSGTTGDPKGVVLTRHNLSTNTEDWLNVLSKLMPTHRVDLLWLPMSHIFGWGEWGLGNLLQFTSYLTTHTAVLSDMLTVKPTVFMSVPAYWEKLYLEAKAASTQPVAQLEKLHELTGGRLKFCLSGGAGLKREVKEFFYAAGLLIIEGYGLTECSPTLTMNRPDDFDFDTVGKPFPRVQLKLASDGEILAQGPNVFSKYYKNPKDTADSFDAEGWFKTGDLGKWTSRGFLQIVGRKKELIVTSGGKNIAPQLIESHFKDDPYIEHIILYGSERKYLTALITLKEENIRNYALTNQIAYQDYATLVQQPEIHALIQQRITAVNEKLASFETIKKFVIYDGHLTVDAGYLTPSFKLKRNKVYQEFREQLDTLYDK